jgi:hypothetical protein
LLRPALQLGTILRAEQVVSKKKQNILLDEVSGYCSLYYQIPIAKNSLNYFIFANISGGCAPVPRWGLRPQTPEIG